MYDVLVGANKREDPMIIALIECWVTHMGQLPISKKYENNRITSYRIFGVLYVPYGTFKKEKSI